MIKYILFTLILTISIENSMAQLSQGGRPLSFSLNSKSNLKTYKMPSFDIKKELKQIESESRKKRPARFAKLFEVKLNSNEHGKWTTLQDGRKIWQLKISSPKALSIGFSFSHFKIPDNALVFVYNTDKSYLIGGFTADNNNLSNILSVSSVLGNEIIIEYNQPAYAAFDAWFEIDQVAHDLKSVVRTPQEIQATTAGSCNININCAEGDEWKLEKQAVCRIKINDLEWCSGTLLNNAKNDGTPYFLTASHCVKNALDAQRTIFYFNYESATCDGSSINTLQTLSGATLVATAPDAKLDFALLRLNNMPPASYNPYFAGWDKRTTNPQTGVSIHHPDGDIKKISKTLSGITTGNYDNEYVANTHWQVSKWSFGTTEGGSSGCGLFNQNHLLVGDLTGGEANCLSPLNDYFQKFSVSWNYFSTASQQLKAWLDPQNTGVEYIYGYDPYNKIYENDVRIVKIEIPSDVNCNTNDLTPTILIQNKGKTVLNNLVISYKIDGGTTVQQFWTGTVAPSATFLLNFPTIQLSSGNHTIEVTATKPNNVDDEDPANNSLQKSFTITSGNQIALTLNTDQYGNETSWQLKDSINQVIYQGSEYLSNATFKSTFCLTPGCYIFEMKDKGGDGMCCTYDKGSYTLTNQSTGQILKIGGNFANSESTIFCIKSEIPTIDIRPDEIKGLQYKNCNLKTITPVFTVQNTGKQTITSFKYKIELDDDNSGELTWIGNLPVSAKVSVDMPKLIIHEGINRLKVITYWPNNTADSPAYNDTLKYNFVNQRGHNLKVVLQTDIFASETTWNLSDNNDKILLNGGPYKNDQPILITDSLCLDENTCYKFSIFDSGNDGICCGYTYNEKPADGYYNLINTTMNETIASGSKFFAEETKSFCTKLSAIETLNSAGLKIYPNPTNAKLTVSAEEIPDRVEILDLTGRCIFKMIPQAETSEIDLSNFTNGVYFIKIETKNQAGIYKIIKL
jgi:lysyl endopeptidase